MTYIVTLGVLASRPALAIPGQVLAHQKISDSEGNFGGILDTEDYFGVSTASLGDLDGDGVLDLAVGANRDDDGGPNRGAVWVLFLNSNGTVRAHQKISSTEGNFTGTLDDDDDFGVSVASLGDLDGDGVDDLAVGAMEDDDGGRGLGAIWILLLYANGTVKAHQKISSTQGGFTGALGGGGFGYSLAFLGDLDGDDIGDLAVGSYGDTNLGAVWILFLNANGTVKAHQKISSAQGGFTGALDEYDYFGSGVALLDDLDGDGIQDIAVGAFNDDDGGPAFSNRGAVWVLFLNTNGTVRAHQKISDTQGGFSGVLDDFDNFGERVACPGDLDGDGVKDLAVGAVGDDDGGSAAGAVWVLFLNSNGTVRAHQKISSTEGNFTGDLDQFDGFGSSVTALGDLNGDGTKDLAVGSGYDDDGGFNRGAVWVLFIDGPAGCTWPFVTSSWEAPKNGSIRLAAACLDSDGDGIPDDWESTGIDLNNDGTPEYVLRLADPLHKDLYVEADAMVGFSPPPQALQDVVDAFADAPVDNPDGTTGIRLHIVKDGAEGCGPCIDDATIPAAHWPTEWNEFDSAKLSFFGSSTERNTIPNWRASPPAPERQAKALVFRYCIFAQSFTGPGGILGYSGNSEDVGGCNDFYVALGPPWMAVTVNEWAATFMHELGHSLGLRHGGSDDINYKPNYFSVMNYLWQLPARKNLLGVAGIALNNFINSWRLDYSRHPIPTYQLLNEDHLNEPMGIGGFWVRWVPIGPRPCAGPACPAPIARIVRMGTNVDWNGDGDAFDVDVQVDVNYLPGQTNASPGQTLPPSENWASLNYLPMTSPAWDDFRTPDQRLTSDPIRELTFDQFMELSNLRFDCNGDGVYDDEQITRGDLSDVNENGVPDICESEVSDALDGPERMNGLHLRVSPNPARWVATVFYQLTTEGQAEISIYDIAGRKVATVYKGSRARGAHSLLWSGRDDAGQEVGAGIYFAKLKSGDRSKTVKFIFVR